MANQWFRMYAEFANDPKVQMLSEVMQRRLVMIFCLRCNDSLKGADDEEIAFSLRIDLGELEKTKDALIKKGFVDKNWNPINWDKRQFLSDKSNSRVAKYREKRKELGLTSNGYTKHSVTVTERDGNCCVYCGSGDNLCIDHVLPVIQGGNDDIDNLVCACKECNSGKSGRTPMQAGYTFQNVYAKDRWERWIKENNVTVTVTPQIQNRTDTDTEQIIVASKLAPCPHHEIISLFAEILPELPQVKVWEGAREKNLANRWKWVLSDLKKKGKPFDKDAGVEFFRRMFAYIAKCDLLMGKKGDWSCSLPWIVEAGNFAKVIEGNYENKEAA